MPSGSLVVVNGVMARQGAKPPSQGLTVRIISAAVMIPPVVAVVVLGTPYFEILVAAGSIVAAWEWANLCGRRGGWLALGALYIGVPSVALVYLRGDPVLGMETVLWIFALVWAADTGAYGFGTVIGGPKLAPAISANKTWAGLAGAILCSGLVGAIAAALLELGGEMRLTAISAGIGMASQAGDLAESWIKRHFRKKDTSGIIPGHGGLLDRIDSLLAASLVVGGVSATELGSVLQWM